MTLKTTKYITALVLIYTAIFVSGCIFNEPCPTPVLFYLRDVKVKSLDKIKLPDGQYEFVRTDTIKNKIAFEVTPSVEITEVKKNYNTSLINVAYGGDCDSGLALNAIIPEKSKLYTNREFYYNGGTVTANTNLLTHHIFKDSINFPTFLDYQGSTMITIENMALKFLDDSYIFTFEWETSDGTLLKDDVEVYFRL